MLRNRLSWRGLPRKPRLRVGAIRLAMVKSACSSGPIVPENVLGDAVVHGYCELASAALLVRCLPYASHVRVVEAEIGEEQVEVSFGFGRSQGRHRHFDLDDLLQVVLSRVRRRLLGQPGTGARRRPGRSRGSPR